MRIHNIILLFITCYLCFGQTFASAGVPYSKHWEPAGFSGAGAYSMVLPDNTTPDKVYVVSDVTEPFVTTDGGSNWSYMPNAGYAIDFTTTIAQSSTNPSTLWTIGRSELMKSTDGGSSWVRKAVFKTFNRGVKVIAIDPADDSHVFVGASADIYETTDGGDNWNKRVILPFNSMVSSYATKSACQAAGASWRTSPSPAQCVVTPQFVYFDQAQNRLILGSSNFGMVNVNLADDTQTFIELSGTYAKYNIDFDVYNDWLSNHFCTTAGKTIACTTDYANWSYTAEATTGNYYFRKFVIDKLSDSSIRIIGNMREVSNQYKDAMKRSTDGGATWASAGAERRDIAVNPTNLWAESVGRNFFSIVQDPFNENTYYFTSDWRIFKSTDGGASWDEKDRGAQNTVMSDCAVSPGRNPRIFCVGMDVGIFYTDNYGGAWKAALPNKTQPYSLYGGHYWRVLTLGPEDAWNEGRGVVVVAFTTYSGAHYYRQWIARSEDNGVTWTLIKFLDKDLYGNTVWDRGYARALAASADGQTIYVGVDGENCQRDPLQPADQCAPSGTNHITGGVFKSTDGGVTWARANGSRFASSPRKTYNALAVDPRDPDAVLMGTWGDNLYHSTNGGRTNSGWRLTNATNLIYDVRYGSDAVPVAVGIESSRPVVYRATATPNATDGGAWEKMKSFDTTGVADGLAIDPADPHRVFVSSTLGLSVKGLRKVWMTTDAQNGKEAVWHDITGDLPLCGCQDLEIVPTEGRNGYLWCAMNGGGIMKLDLAETAAQPEPPVQPIACNQVLGGFQCTKIHAYLRTYGNNDRLARTLYMIKRGMAQ